MDLSTSLILANKVAEAYSRFAPFMASLLLILLMPVIFGVRAWYCFVVNVPVVESQKKSRIK